MTEHPLIQVMRSVPINKAARQAVRQGACSAHEGDLTKAELDYIKARLLRKLQLLKVVLRIDNKRKHKNLLTTIKKGSGSGLNRVLTNPRAATEYVRCGLEIHRMEQGLRDIRLTTVAPNRAVQS